MRRIKLTAVSLILVALVISVASCERDAERAKTTEYLKSDIAMTGSNEAPIQVVTGALGSMDVYYAKNSQVLTYKLSWSGLSGNPTSIGLFGLAPIGYAAPAPTPVQTIPVTGLTSSGSYSGSVNVDGVVIKEQDVLNGLYYINIKTAANPAGEIRGQVVFQ